MPTKQRPGNWAWAESKDSLSDSVPYRNEKDLTDRPRGYWLIDIFGMSAAEVRSQYPEVYQWVLERA